MNFRCSHLGRNQHARNSLASASHMPDRVWRGELPSNTSTCLIGQKAMRIRCFVQPCELYSAKTAPMHRGNSAFRQKAETAIGPPTLADRMHLEANFFELSVVQDTTTIEEECRLHHRTVELGIWVLFELVPLCQHGNRMCRLHCLPRGAAEDQPAFVDLHVVILELSHGILLLDLGVEDMHTGTILQQHLYHLQRGCLSHIASVLLESEAEDCDLLVGHGVEEAGDDLVSEVFLLVLVHIDHHLPVTCTFVQTFALANVHQVQDILLEARTTEAHRSPKELRTDPGVCAYSPRDFRNIGAGFLAQLRDGVHAAYPLCQHCIGNKLRKL